MVVLTAPALALEGGLPKDLWETWKSRFVAADGRVIDNVNGRISHSEGQGYGMLLALAAGDREAFDRIWRFTHNRMYVRGDALAAWRFEPRDPSDTECDDPVGQITDTNNATDGDILIAWALAEAGRAGYGFAYAKQAHRIALAIEEKTFYDYQGFGLQIMPAAKGFSPSECGGRPVVNLSYWVFPAMPVLSEVTGSPAWRAVFDSGFAHLDRIGHFPAALPPDWIALDLPKGKLRFAEGMDDDFSYNAIRIPIYLAMLGPSASPLLEQRFAHWFETEGDLHTVDVATGRLMEPLSAPGFEAIRGLYWCAVRGEPVGAEFWTSLDPDYYPATLKLLSALTIRKNFAACIEQG